MPTPLLFPIGYIVVAAGLIILLMKTVNRRGEESSITKGTKIAILIGAVVFAVFGFFAIGGILLVLAFANAPAEGD